MKKFLALLLVSIMLVSVFAGCDSGSSGGYDRNDYDDDQDLVSNNDISNGDSSAIVETSDKLEGKNGEDISYVLIYNPNIYDENVDSNIALNTGSFAAQIDVDAARGEDLKEERPEWGTLDQGSINSDFPIGDFNLEGNRGDVISPSYELGDTAEFYAFTGYTLNASRTKVKFTCSYAGTKCNIWTYNVNLSSDMINEYGKEFDNNIFNKVVTTFGEPRFDGKINLMFYSLPRGIGGLFANADIFATGEATEQEVSTYGMNLNHNMLHINADYANYTTVINGTMAHEFQHLICMTNFFYTINGVQTGTWLNEAMSGYIEEKLYSGTKEESGHLRDFFNGSTVKHGQSIYNFASEKDIGVYGSVYYFSEYLSKLAGDDVFSNLHEYWRSSYSSTLDDAEAIANAVPKSVYNKINTSVTYPSSLSFKTETQEWMSKLMLDFYISIIKYDSTDPAAFQKINSADLLYDEINAATIEGGGRIYVATSGNTFEIPNDADSGLIYVGLNSDFEVVTDYIYH